MNIKSIKAFLWKNRVGIALILIMIFALLLRLYRLDRWVYLESDQARDLRVVKNAFENGIAELPLLGPKASGSDLHLGPVFYYFQYFSVVIFGNMEPHVLVFPDLLFSILAIPLFYYFLRQFFSKKVSLLVSLVFASSYILTQFARFAWNPNSIPFWSLLGFTAVLKFYTQKDRTKAGWWLVLMAFSYAIIGQLHFLAFLGFPLAVLMFWFLHRPPKVALSFWFLSLVTILFVNLPLFVNDLKGGDNWKQFLAVVLEGRDTREQEGVLATFTRMIRYQSEYYTNFLTSLNKNETQWTELIGLVLIVIFIVTVMYLKNKKRLIGKNCPEKVAFLNLTLCWFFGYLPLFYKLAFDLNRPRYWLAVFIFPFLALAFILRLLFKQKNRGINFLAYAVVMVILFLNLSAIFKLFLSIDKQQEVFFQRKWSSRTLRQRGLETADNQRLVAEYMINVAQAKGKNGICFKSQNILTSVYTYFIAEKGGKVFYKGPLNKEIFKKHETDCTFFLIQSKHKEVSRIRKELKSDLELRNRNEIGVSAVWEVE